MYDKHGNLVDADATSAKTSTRRRLPSHKTTSQTVILINLYFFIVSKLYEVLSSCVLHILNHVSLPMAVCFRDLCDLL